MNFNKVVEPARLKTEIEASSITVALDSIVVSGNTTTVLFKAALSTEEQTTLQTIVDNHVATPLANPSMTVQVETSPPFAKPDYRTKWNAVPNVVVMSNDEVQTIDHTITEERYCHGGELVFTGAKLGDWVEAQIVDPNGTIPEPYRASLAENYPVIATYIEKYYLAEGNGTKELNTYPLNAKITVGLVLRVILHTTSDLGQRKFATNYLLTKKLV